MADYTALSQTNTAATPVTNTLHNQIAANDAYFKDSPEMNKITVPIIDTGSGEVTNALDQAVKTTDSITHVDGAFTGNVSIDGSILPTITPTTSNWTVTTTPQIIPRGVYILSGLSAGSGFAFVEFLEGATWRVILGGNQVSGGTILSDGTNVRVRRTVDTQPVYYMKF